MKAVRLFRVFFIVLTSCVGLAACSEAEGDHRPNIILIVADDMGYGDAACYGNTNLVKTPNIDRLADEGVLFTDGYVTAPLCAPCRYGLLTGVYQQKFGVRWNVDAALNLSMYGIEETMEDNRIPKPIEVISEPLERAGYASVLLGKWNLPMYPQTTFDESYSTMHFVGEFFPDESGRYKGVDGVPAQHDQARHLWGPERKGDEYLTDRIGRQAVEYINKHKDSPFFMFVGFNAPHTPLHAKKEHLKHVEHLDSEALKLYGAMLYSMDENIGSILNALDDNKISDNTLVAFISDNGATFAYPLNWPEEWEKELLGSNGNLRGHKTQMYEGGIRIPFIIRYPKVLEAGKVYREPVISLDLYPTFCNVAGAEPLHNEKLDGVDLIPYLNGENTGSPHNILYWYGENKGAVRQGKYKYFNYKGEVELYNLEDDISEANDLSESLPGIRKKLDDRYYAFINSLPPPVNPNRADKFIPDKK